MPRLCPRPHAARLASVARHALLGLALAMSACATPGPAKTVSGEAIHQQDASRARCWGWIVQSPPDAIRWELLLDELDAEPAPIQAQSVTSLLPLLDERWPDEVRVLPAHWSPDYLAQRPHLAPLIRHLQPLALRQSPWRDADGHLSPAAFSSELTLLTVTSPQELEAAIAAEATLTKLSRVDLALYNEQLVAALEALAASALGPRLRELRLTRGVSADAQRALVRVHKRFARLDALELNGIFADPLLSADPGQVMRAVFLAYAPRLSALRLRRSALRDALAHSLLAARAYPRLRQLELSSTAMSPQAVASLTTLRLPALRELELSGSRLDAQTTAALVSAPSMSGLTSLRLRYAALNDDAIAWLGHTDALSTLRTLDLSHNALTAAGMGRLFGPGKLRQLRQLHLQANPLRGGGLAQLVRSRSVEQLQLLDARWCGVGDDDLIALASTPSALRELTLEQGSVTARGARALATAPWFSSLEVLDLSQHPLGDEGVEALAAPGAPFLRELRLNNTQLADRGLIALLQSDRVRLVQALELRHNLWSHEAALALGRARTLERLTEAQLTASRLGTPENLAKMADSPSALHLSRVRLSYAMLDLGPEHEQLRQSRGAPSKEVGAQLAARMSHLPKLGESVVQSPYLSAAMRRHLHEQLTRALRDLERPAVKAQLPAAAHVLAMGYVRHLDELNRARMPALLIRERPAGSPQAPPASP